MPILEIGLAAGAAIGVAAAAATSYLVPLIIACGAGLIATIVSFFTGHAIAEGQAHIESQKVSDLKKEQLERDKRTRAAAEVIVMHTDHEVKALLDQSKRQQRQFGSSIEQFNQNMLDTSQATENLERVAESIQSAANDSSCTMGSLLTELERLKYELVTVNELLKETQDALSEKDQQLKDTIEKLNELEQQMKIDQDMNNTHLLQLKTGMNELQNMLAQELSRHSLKDIEIQSVKEKINKLTSTIQRLEYTVSNLTNKLVDSNEENNTHLQEIRMLLNENKALINTIDQLSETLERQTETSNKSASYTQQIRLFK